MTKAMIVHRPAASFHGSLLRHLFLLSCLFVCFVGILSSPSFAVQLENWRLPYYRLAADLSLVSSSPSGMFWDDLSGSADFASRLWPDSGRYAKNHWALEPLVAGGYDAGTYFDGKTSFYHAELLSDIRLWRLTARQTLDVDSRYVGDERYPWMKDRNLAGRFEEAYLQGDWKWGMARLGRLKRNWGPFADRSLLLSSNPYSYDALEWQIHNRIFEFRHLFGVFPWQRSGFDTDDGRMTGRYLTAHSLNFRLGKWASLGLTETVLFAQEDGIPDLQYVNPLSIYFVTNTNGESSGNLMLGFQGMVHPFTERVTVKGQVVIDDFQFDNEDAGDQEPAHWGLDVGAFWRDPLPVRMHSLVKAEYRYLSRWLYTVNDGNADRGERYIYLGRSLGQESIDGDEVHVAFSLLGTDFWVGTAGLRYGRWGGNTPLTRWSACSTYTVSALGYREETPLSQREDLERTLDIYLEARGYFRDFVDAGLSFTNRMTRDPGASSFGYDPVVAVELSLHYADFFLSARR